MRISFHKLIKWALICVYLVIIAGAVVRMTGSGMGCPDWPKCFGYYIPPTDGSQLQWQPQKSFKKGQVIIREESLQVAIHDFTTSSEYQPNHWEAYTKHDYAVFNVAHTWTEYINRLMGALAGLATLVLAIFSIGKWKTDKRLTLLSWLVVLAMGFQGWLGATVVYSVLEPVKITVHMLVALGIVALLLWILFLSKGKDALPHTFNTKVHGLLWATLVLTLVQIAVGTQVRQFIDDQVSILGYGAKNLWLQHPTTGFYLHRSFSILVVVANLYLAHLVAKNSLKRYNMKWVLGLLAIEVVSGVAMYYLDFPFLSQPIHLVFASILFGLQFYMLLKSHAAKRKQNFVHLSAR
ncbi:MAG: heme A synthase [Flavobacteriaceae bacterium]